jgi:hypothetical protein
MPSKVAAELGLIYRVEQFAPQMDIPFSIWRDFRPAESTNWALAKSVKVKSVRRRTVDTKVVAVRCGYMDRIPVP